MRKKVMVVDDEAPARKLLSIILQRAGYDVIEAGDSRGVQEQLKSQTPDLFILDVMMPGMDGIELCQRLRAFSQTADTPIIILSARSDPHSIEEGLRAGANDFIPKPVLHRHLVVKVNELLGPHHPCSHC